MSSISRCFDSPLRNNGIVHAKLSTDNMLDLSRGFGFSVVLVRSIFHREAFHWVAASKLSVGARKHIGQSDRFGCVSDIDIFVDGWRAHSLGHSSSSGGSDNKRNDCDKCDKREWGSNAHGIRI